MKKQISIILVLVSACFMWADQSFHVGREQIIFMPPVDEMSEVGYDNRELMEIFVPTTNRLVAAYLLNSDIPKLHEMDENAMFSRYAMVQTLRQAEYLECGVAEFGDVTAGAKEMMGDILDQSTKEAEEEFNRRMSALDLDEVKMTFGKPINLGALFSMENAYGFGTITPMTAAQETYNIGMACGMLRVKNRLVVFYLYSIYENEADLQWLRTTSTNWAQSILAANKQ